MGDKFDVDFKLLPPELKVKLWVLALDADTSKVNLAYQPGQFKTSLTYNYGGAAVAGFSMRRFSANLGYDPGKKNLDLGLVFRGFRFNAGANLDGKSASVGLAYGAPLLPYPDELASVFNAGALSLHNIAGNIGSAPDNPLAFYKTYSNDFSTVSKAIGYGSKIQKSSKGTDRFGASLRLAHSGEGVLTIMAGAAVRF